MIKLSDYVVDYLARHGVNEIFLVSGGGIMHLVDSVGRNPRMRYVCNYHEQACAIAAEACARVKNHIAACLVTTGPGATNALSGIAGAWFDSIPVLVLSGQVRTPLIADYKKIRQLGPQEVDILPMARPVTKYSASVRDPRTIRAELERAFAAATSDRPGPVWLELPLDIQAATIDESRLPLEGNRSAPRSSDRLPEQTASAVEMLREAKRPVLILGHGVRLAGCPEELSRLLDATRIPILLTIGGMDLVAEDHPSHMGAFGPVGRRAANFALQNSDLLLAIGASFSIASIGFDTAGFAPRAKRIVVNIDEGELTKENVRADLGIRASAGEFLSALLEELGRRSIPVSRKWLEACADWKRKYPAVAPEAHTSAGFVNSYAFAETLSECLGEGAVVVTGNSLDACSIYQAFRVKSGQRVLLPTNYGAMGWDLPAAVGACVAHDGQVVLVTGDGSLQFNVQELQTARQNDLPLKIFVFNNDGYESIRTTQETHFEGRHVGSSRASGVGNPDFEMLAAAYRLAYRRISSPASMKAQISEFLALDGPALCELILSPTQGRSPRVTSFRREDGTLESRPLEDMFPFLSRDELQRNMHLFDDEDASV
jgi:acetolactate synthase I/II/III large subunit